MIMDEVLAVGDVAFQNKCIEKMTQISKSGRTILYVSHKTHKAEFSMTISASMFIIKL